MPSGEMDEAKPDREPDSALNKAAEDLMTQAPSGATEASLARTEVKSIPATGSSLPKVSLEDTTLKGVPPLEEPKIHQSYLGLYLSGGIIGLIVIILIFSGLLISCTHASLKEMKDVLKIQDNPSENVINAVKEMESAWFIQIKSIIEIMYIPLLSLLGTIVGYIFGHNTAKDDKK